MASRSRCQNNFRKLRAKLRRRWIGVSERSVTRVRGISIQLYECCWSVVDVHPRIPSISRSNEADLLVGERARRAVPLTNLTTWSGTTLRILTNRDPLPPPPPPPVFLDRVSFSQDRWILMGNFRLTPRPSVGFESGWHFVRSVIHPLLHPELLME